MIVALLRMTDDPLPAEMVPVVLVTLVLAMVRMPPPVASSVPLLVVGPFWMVSVLSETLALTMPWLVKFKFKIKPCPSIVLSLFTRVSVLVELLSWDKALLRLTVPPPERLTVAASTTRLPLPVLFPIETIPLLVRSPVRKVLFPGLTKKVDPEVMVTPWRKAPSPWIAAPLALVRGPPMIVEPLRMTDDAAARGDGARWCWSRFLRVAACRPRSLRASRCWSSWR